MPNPIAIQIFVPDGDPESLRIIERRSTPNKFFCFPRDKWQQAKSRSELQGAGVYILTGYSNPDDELPTIYIGQADKVYSRINQHVDHKAFWDRAIVFVSDGNRLNSAHVKWLEHMLIKRVNETKRSLVENGNVPNKPTISESDEAELNIFLAEIYQTLPLAGLMAFEEPRIVAKNHASKQSDGSKDMIIVPARKDGFERVFMRERSWWAIRISGGMLDKIKYIAAYQVAPISAITHYAEVSSIESIGEEGKYKLNFAHPARELEHIITIGPKSNAGLQGPRYTSFSKLMKARTIQDL